MSDSVRPHIRQPTRLPRPWDSPGKNPGVGCHFLLQCVKVKMNMKLLSHVWLLATPWTAAYQVPPSMGFSRQEYWSGVPLRWSHKISENPWQQATGLPAAVLGRTGRLDVTKKETWKNFFSLGHAGPAESPREPLLLNLEEGSCENLIL